MQNNNSSVYIFASGTEITSGTVIDRNSPSLANSLRNIGFMISGIGILPDSPHLISKSFQFVLDELEPEIIIITGGLGSTADDHTIDVLSKLSKVEIELDLETVEKIESILKIKNRESEKDIFMRQARIFKGSTVLKNRYGLAPGMIHSIRNKGGKKIDLIVLPGVPHEMNEMFEEQALPYLKKLFSGTLNYRKSFYLYETGESKFQSEFIQSEDIKNIGAPFEWGVSSKIGRIQIFFESHNEMVTKSLFAAAKNFYGDTLMEQEVHETLYSLCSNRKVDLSFGESCTGGFAGKLITDIPGSSKIFAGSAVTYSNEAKKKLLGVTEEIIQKYGAVSEECAIAMVTGVRKIFDTDYALSITGIAGPEGGSTEKPVGTVFLGISGKNKKTVCQKIYIRGNREVVREFTVQTALYRLYRYLLDL